MNNLNSDWDERIASSGDESQRLAEDLAALHRLPVPAMSFDPVAGTDRRPLVAMKQRWRPALLGTAAAAALAAFVIGPGAFGGSPQPVSAQEVFEKAHAIVALAAPVPSDISYHMVAITESFGPPGMQAATVNSTTETWYQDPEHQRYETYGEDGELVFGNVQNGDDLWFYSDAQGADGSDELRVVHSAQGTAGFMPIGAQDFGVDSLAGLLEMYSGQCAQAESIGEEVVAGRPTYVIEVTQTPETCDIKPVITQEGDRTSVKVEAPDGAGFGVAGVAVGSVNVKGEAGVPAEGSADGAEPTFSFQVIETTTRMWVDQETFISLKTETESEDGLLFRYEVTEFEVDPDFDPAIFTYEPPAGVEVVEAESPEDIKIVLSGGRMITGGSFEAGQSIESVEDDTAP